MAAFYRVFKNKWITPPKPTNEDYSGRTIIVTGSTSGIGVEAVYKFATLGAEKVIMTARDPQKGKKIKAELEARLGRKDQLEVWDLDMMSYDSCLAFTKRASQLQRLDILVLNAGTWRASHHLSQYGWEEAIQVNTLSNTLIALSLLPKLRETKRLTGRTTILEFVNSGLHESAIVSEDARSDESILAYYSTKEQFDEGKQYKFSKVFLMYVARIMADAISSEEVIITSVCPGWVMTGIGRDRFFPGMTVVFYLMILLFIRTPAQGADMELSGTTQGEAVHGRFWRHDQIQPIPQSLKGDEMKQVGLRVFDEVVDAISKDVPEFRGIADTVLAKDK